MSHETERDSEDLLYYAQRGAEKQYQLARIREKARGMGELAPERIPLIHEAMRVENKFEVAKYDLEKVLERYAGRVSVSAAPTHVKANLTTVAETDNVIIEGILTKVDYKKALFKIATVSESVEVTYADFILREGCTYPSPQSVIELELISPV